MAEMAGSIKQISAGMLKLIEELLQSNLIEDGNLKLNRKPQVLEDLVSQVVKSNQHLAANKNQQLVFMCKASPEIEIDARRIREVLDNLVSNAIKYSPQGGKIEVTLSETENTVKIEVTDNGPGLTEEDKIKLFGKFQRLSAKPTGGESSTGLGLCIVKMLIELHNGTVNAYSDGLGTGTTFVIELPKEPELRLTEVARNSFLMLN